MDIKRDYVNILINVLIIFLVFNIIVSLLAGSELSRKLDLRIEAAKPVQISIIKISADCPDCFDLTPVINSIKSGNVNVTEEKEIKFEDAKEIIEEYKITKLPTFLIKGDIEKLPKQGFENVSNVLVFRNVMAPYFDVKDKQIEGLVKIKVISVKSCDKCIDLSFIKLQLEKVGVKIDSYETFDMNAKEAKEIIEEYKITKLPTMLVSKDFGVYDIVKAWSSIGIKNDDGSYLLTKVQPPYYDLAENVVKGLVNLFVIYDKNCLECQDKSLQKTALKSLGISFVNENEYDVDSKEGRDLIKKYGVTKLPATILSKEASTYEALLQVWSQVGTIEGDGSYILRKADLLGSYKDLSTGEVVKKTEES
ncbi:hypothetical protein HY498_02075 [Candidatus Woesearchaeota archaeon]|nr:hypothetical protein [Candidatus Woesearchaeota archaeon]